MAGRQSIEERLAQIKAREEKMRRERSRLTARLQVSERKRDTRRKILLGSLVLAKLESSPKLREFVQRELPGFLTRAEDRALFAVIVELQADGMDAHAAVPDRTEAGVPELA